MRIVRPAHNGKLQRELQTLRGSFPSSWSKLVRDCPSNKQINKQTKRTVLGSLAAGSQDGSQYVSIMGIWM